jgi:hypothetical protein
MKTAHSTVTVAGLSLILLLCGCVTPNGLHSDDAGPSSLERKFYLSITSFHDLPSDTTGRSFVVLGDTNLIGSLEQELYLRVVREEFESHQYRPVEVTDTPDWLVMVEYENLPPKKHSSATEENHFIGWRVRLQIYDGAAYRQRKAKQIFDVRMTAAGTGGSLSQAFPVLMRELFRSFPGTSGAKRGRYVSY